MDILTFNLVNAFQQAECPVCYLKRTYEARYIFMLLWENVNDSNTRARFVDALGFCRSHAWQLVETERDRFGGGLGTGILYQDLTHRARQGLAELRQRENLWARLSWLERGCQMVYKWLRRKSFERYIIGFPSALVAQAECRVCQIGRETEVAYVDALGKACAEGEFRERYRASMGLCLPHLRAAIETSHDPATRVFLIETAEAKLETLAHQLAEYLRKQIWDYRDEPKIAAEQSAWLRAVEFFVGKP
jgi:hypothetical protein